MNKQDISNIAQDHKKLLEKVDICPYEFHKDSHVYRMAHFYRLSSKLYGSFVFTPYDISFEDVKMVFYKFILLEEYMKDKLSKVNDYASTDFTASYLGYRQELNEKIEDSSFIDAQEIIQEMIKAIDFFESSLKNIRETYSDFKKMIKKIETTNVFIEEQLSDIQRLYGKVHAYQFLQAAKQKELIHSSRELVVYMDKKKLFTNGLVNFYKKTKIMASEDSENRLDHSIKGFGDYKENLTLTFKELEEKFVKKNEKDFYQALDENFIKRRVRNPSVQKL
ncbi:hypothetical protein [Bacillus sp. KH172YL63]|uniref:hypothetical protein n=1 Tax=Bacillus sp. KH172YL63 TaxID=2709784 RepID=UPI0013E4385A|nr:hypothetical protein [Bacillus sp. KH172YL63]BCB02165.1 hypothetical protein KH172YL63_02980 [Bacillus sp. KH172YL63]